MNPASGLNTLNISQPQQGPSRPTEDYTPGNQFAKKRFKIVRSLSLSVIDSSGERRDKGFSESSEITTTTVVSVESEEFNDNKSEETHAGEMEDENKSWWWWWEPSGGGSLLLDFCRQTVRQQF